ncbi:MAG: hypothetical protein ACREIC_25855, partial [Limisphaerales bacterium]
MNSPEDRSVEATGPEPSTRFTIRAAREADTAAILQLIGELAAYERLLDEVTATEAGLRQQLFGPRPMAEVLL